MTARDPQRPILKILERLPVPALIANPVTAKILWVNTRIVRMAAANHPDEIVGASILDYVQLPQASTALADLAKVALGQSPPPVTYQLRKQTGEYAAAQVASMPMIFDGKPAMLSIVTDVSEREALIRELEESQERYRSLLETMPSGVVVVVDESIMYANRALACGLGYEASEIIGRSMYDFIEEVQRRPIREARREVILTGKPVPPAPVTLIHRDGSRVHTTAATTRIRWDGVPATQTLMHELCPE